MVHLGILALQGDVIEHIRATTSAFQNLSTEGTITEVRTAADLNGLSGLIIPGGESTVLYKLITREGFFEELKRIPCIFGTCAGAIMLAKTVHHKEEGQKTLELMDIEVDRNAYGRQTDSFETDIETTLGKIHAIFIRAPKITHIATTVNILASIGHEVIACEQKTTASYYLAMSFHPELTTTVLHEYFIKNVIVRTPQKNPAL